METTETVNTSLQPPDAAVARQATEPTRLVLQRRLDMLGPRAVASVVFLVYGLVLAAFIAAGHDPRNLEMQGRRFVAQGGLASAVIRLDPSYIYPGGDIGYDGQFYSYIALDPLHAAAHIDDPAGRMGRIIYPLLARLLAFGQPALIPWTLIAVNWLAVVGGTWLAALWLARRGVSPWWALIYGLSGGLCIGFALDLTEPLAYALALAGLLALDSAQDEGNGHVERSRLLTAGVLFALAALTRETALAFPVAVALAWLLQRRAGAERTEPRHGWSHWLQTSRWQESAALLTLAVAPYFVWKLALHVWIGGNVAPKNWLPAPYPFAGLIALWPWAPQQQLALLLVAIPALVAMPLAVAALRRTHGHSGVAWALALNILWLVVFLPRDSWVDTDAAVRISNGVALAAVLCIPLWTRRQRGALLAIGVAWCLLTLPILFNLVTIGLI